MVNVCDAFGCTPDVAVVQLGGKLPRGRVLARLTTACIDVKIARSCIEKVEAASKAGTADKPVAPEFDHDQSEWFRDFLRHANACKFCLAMPGSTHEDWCPIELACEACGVLPGKPHASGCPVAHGEGGEAAGAGDGGPLLLPPPEGA